MCMKVYTYVYRNFDVGYCAMQCDAAFAEAKKACLDFCKFRIAHLDKHMVSIFLLLHVYDLVPLRHALVLGGAECQKVRCTG